MKTREVKDVIKSTFWVTAYVLAVLTVGYWTVVLAGCTEQQKQQGDKLATNASGIATTAATLSPAVPPPVGPIVGILAGVVLTLAGAWQTYRKGQISAALDDVGQAGATTNKTSTVLDAANPILAAINPSTVAELKALGH
jgi:outer membrane murein-binding lipoprotein Lpp